MVSCIFVNGKLTSVRVRDIIGDNAFFVAESGAFPRSFSGKLHSSLLS